MGTRGSYGFHKNQKDKVTYNHFDSYPTCLGVEIFKFVHPDGSLDLAQIRRVNRAFPQQ